MIILDCTVPNIGRILIHEDYSIEEVSFVPGLDQAEVMALEETMINKAAPWVSYHEALLSALATLYGIVPAVTFHADNSKPLVPELPDMP